MLQDEITFQIRQDFRFEPTADQANALHVFAAFLSDHNDRAVMILRGSAGTGKTSLAGAIVRTMMRLKQKTVLMAPTGRAAKVFSLNSGVPAFTIHRRIYRERSFAGVDSTFNLNDNLHTDTLFVVDEASMISAASGASSFGSGSLLNDLVRYVYGGRNDRMLLIGDKAQLPPVGEAESPALCGDVLGRYYSLKVYECDLDEVIRQGRGSGILWNATMVRQLITHDETTRLPKIRFRAFADIHNVPGDELIEQMASSYSRVGLDETIVITRSNKRANIYNQGVRNTILDREEALCTGDVLMVVKNKYLQTDGKAEEGCPTFIANGDRGVVKRVHNVREFYGFHFADVVIEFPDYDYFELDTTVIMDTLTSEAPALTRDQNEQLFAAVTEDYADVPLKHDRMRRVREDDYYNALQIKFGYAVTCHKAQGGQWADVYVDQGYMTDDMLTPDYIHWLYTAFTRATEHLYLVNWPRTQTDDPS